MDLSNSHLFADVVRVAYLERRSGVCEVELTGKRKKLFFREGELYLHPLDKLTEFLGPLLRDGEVERPASVPELRGAVDKLIYECCEHPNTMARLLEHGELPANLLGPLPTVCLAMEAAVHDCGETALVRRLGGSEARFQSASGPTPALSQLPGLDPEISQVLVGLEKPVTVADLLRGKSQEHARLVLLRGLAQLHAIGLVEAVDEGRRTLVSSKLLKRFEVRVGDSLKIDPLALEPEEHREEVTELLQRIGDLDHYALLGIGPGAAEDEVLAAYNRLARRAHPGHAELLGFAGREDTLRLLFERATEAYLVLSDPSRRSSYNNLVGTHTKVVVDDERRKEEKRGLAREIYQRAVKVVAQRDYSRAVDLLKEAVRLDPRPEYLARLGLAQARNPNWRRHAAESCRKAVEMKPSDVGIRMVNGKVLQILGQLDDARSEYQEVLRLEPGHERAGAALRKLAEKEAAAEAVASMGGEEIDVEVIDEDLPDTWEI